MTELVTYHPSLYPLLQVEDKEDVYEVVSVRKALPGVEEEDEAEVMKRKQRAGEWVDDEDDEDDDDEDENVIESDDDENGEENQDEAQEFVIQENEEPGVFINKDDVKNKLLGIINAVDQQPRMKIDDFESLVCTTLSISRQPPQPKPVKVQNQENAFDSSVPTTATNTTTVFKCDVCDMEFHDLTSYEKHKQQHNQ